MTVNPAPQISMLNRTGVFSEVGVWFFVHSTQPAKWNLNIEILGEGGLYFPEGLISSSTYGSARGRGASKSAFESLQRAPPLIWSKNVTNEAFLVRS